MINIPAPVMRVAGKAGNWLVKNGPKIMSVCGGMMAVGGAVMACEATLHADEVLDRHRQKMAKIEAAKAVSDESGDGAFTEMDVKRGKAGVYFETAVDFAKLYAPSVAVGFAGVGLMQGAFIVTERRRASAVAALTTMDQMYQNLLSRTEEQVPELRLAEHNPSIVKSDDSDDVPDKLLVNPEDELDPFFLMFDVDNPSFENTFGNKRAEFLTNERFITSTIDAFNYRLSGHAVDHVWVNDVRNALGMGEKGIGQFYGWNGNNGDLIEYEIIPFVKEWNDEGDKQFPLLVQIDRDELEELEASDIQEGYCIGVRLKSSSDGYDDIVDPRFIYNEVYGD